MVQSVIFAPTGFFWGPTFGSLGFFLDSTFGSPGFFLGPTVGPGLILGPTFGLLVFFLDPTSGSPFFWEALLLGQVWFWALLLGARFFFWPLVIFLVEPIFSINDVRVSKKPLEVFLLDPKKWWDEFPLTKQITCSSFQIQVCFWTLKIQVGPPKNLGAETQCLRLGLFFRPYRFFSGPYSGTELKVLLGLSN